jgi:hypothetical protein
MDWWLKKEPENMNSGIIEANLKLIEEATQYQNEQFMFTAEVYRVMLRLNPINLQLTIYEKDLNPYILDNFSNTDILQQFNEAIKKVNISNPVEQFNTYIDNVIIKSINRSFVELLKIPSQYIPNIMDYLPHFPDLETISTVAGNRVKKALNPIEYNLLQLELKFNKVKDSFHKCSTTTLWLKPSKEKIIKYLYPRQGDMIETFYQFKTDMELAFETVLHELIEQHKELYQYQLNGFRIVGEIGFPLEPMFSSIRQLSRDMEKAKPVFKLALNNLVQQGISIKSESYLRDYYSLI